MVTISPPPRFLIAAIRERHKTSAGQFVEPVFVVGRVTCTQVLIEGEEETEEEGEDAVEKGRRSYMYSYRVELVDASGEKITGVLRPGLHEQASEEAFTQGMRIKLTGWKVREAVTAGGKEVLFLDLEELEVVGHEEDGEGGDVGEKVGSSVGKSENYLSCASSWGGVTASATSTVREVEEQLRNESTGGWGHDQGEVVKKPSPVPAQPGSGVCKPKESTDDEETSDYGTDYLFSIGSFSTPPLLGTQVPLEPETTLPEATQKDELDASFPMVKLPDDKSVALSTLGKRFLDHPKTSQDSVPPFSSSSSGPPTAKKPRITGGSSSNAFTTPTERTGRPGRPGAQHPSTAVSKPNIPPHTSPRTPTPTFTFSSAAAIHAGRVEAPTKTPINIWSLLRPCLLADLPSRPHGSKVDILAIIYSIDTHLITRNKSVKRDCRLVDPSSPPLVPAPSQPHRKQPHHNELKPTILSVWVKPQSFIPRVGTLVAFRGLTVHRYAGRSLNAFSDVAGSVWYLENPGSEIDGAEEMGEWWADRCMRELAEELEREEEREKREREKRERERSMDGGARGNGGSK